MVFLLCQLQAKPAVVKRFLGKKRKRQKHVGDEDMNTNTLYMAVTNNAKCEYHSQLYGRSSFAIHNTIICVIFSKISGKRMSFLVFPYVSNILKSDFTIYKDLNDPGRRQFLLVDCKDVAFCHGTASCSGCPPTYEHSSSGLCS